MSTTWRIGLPGGPFAAGDLVPSPGDTPLLGSGGGGRGPAFWWQLPNRPLLSRKDAHQGRKGRIVSEGFAQSPNMSLRSRNRLMARRHVQATALDLFEQKGFDSVTVEQVAEAAAVSPSTVYRHFGSKENLVLWDEHNGAIEKALGKTLGKLPPFEALGQAFLKGYSDLELPALELLHRRGDLIDQNPAVFAAMAASLDEDRVALQDALAASYPAPVFEMQMEMVARIALTAFIAGFATWQDRGPRSCLPDAIEQAFRAARKALDA
jgi:AcrR family transcriptional regulator